MSLIQFQEKLESVVIHLGPLFIRAGVVFLIGALLRKIALGMFSRLLVRNHVDLTQAGFFQKVVGVTLWIIILLTVLAQLGVETTSIVAIVGAAGLGIGLALKDSMQNLASGFMLTVHQPFRAGDIIEISGQIATVDQIGIFTTHLTTLDNKKLFLPNNEVFGKPLLNYTGNEKRRIDLTIRIAYCEELQRVRRIIEETLLAEKGVLREPEHFIGVWELSPSSIDLVVRAWTNTQDYFVVRCALLESIKEALEREKVKIPFPQLELHTKD